MKYRGYVISESNDRGGKAGRGRNLTKTIQVQDHGPNSPVGGYLLLKSIRYRLYEAGAKEKAIAKAKAFIDGECGGSLPVGEKQQ